MKNCDWRLRVAAEHPALAGHFPGTPIVPGALLLDTALLALRQQLGDKAMQTLQIQSVKFHRPLRPDEEVRLNYTQHADGVTHFELMCDQNRIASGTLAVTPTTGAT